MCKLSAFLWQITPRELFQALRYYGAHLSISSKVLMKSVYPGFPTQCSIYPRLRSTSNTKMNSMDEKQSFIHGPGSHLSLHTWQEETQPERPHLPEIKVSPQRIVTPGALPLSCATESCIKVVMHANIPGLFHPCQFPGMTLQIWIRGTPLFPFQHNQRKKAHDTAV